MEDAAIVALYWARDEQALAETAAKFGAYCRKIADNILHSAHDAEECENDTWLAAWNSMPTNRPARLAPYLGRITRNLALDRFDRTAAQKRGSGWTKLPPKSAAAGRPVRRWTSWPNASPRRAAWRTALTLPRPGGSSARFCGGRVRRAASSSCGGTGTGRVWRILPPE